jgi:hypothetical protein
MNVTCRKCDATIKVPEDKIPKGRPFSFKCPSCKEKVVVQPVDDAGGPDLYDTARFETGTLRHGAMVCHTEPETVLKITDALGFTAHAPGTHAEALARLRYNEYGLIIVTEEFEKMPHKGVSVLETLQKLVMQKRRKLFLVYAAPNVESSERLEATALSVNLLVSTGDMKKSGKIANTIKRGMAEHHLNYKVYNESLSSIGSI